MNEINGRDRAKLYDALLKVAKRKTEVADKKIDESGKFVDEEEADFGENVLIVKHDEPEAAATGANDEGTTSAASSAKKPKKKKG